MPVSPSRWQESDCAPSSRSRSTSQTPPSAAPAWPRSSAHTCEAGEAERWDATQNRSVRSLGEAKFGAGRAAARRPPERNHRRSPLPCSQLGTRRRLLTASSSSRARHAQHQPVHAAALHPRVQRFNYYLIELVFFSTLKRGAAGSALPALRTAMRQPRVLTEREQNSHAAGRLMNSSNSSQWLEGWRHPLARSSVTCRWLELRCRVHANRADLARRAHHRHGVRAPLAQHVGRLREPPQDVEAGRAGTRLCLADVARAAARGAPGDGPPGGVPRRRAARGRRHGQDQGRREAAARDRVAFSSSCIK